MFHQIPAESQGQFGNACALVFVRASTVPLHIWSYGYICFVKKHILNHKESRKISSPEVSTKASQNGQTSLKSFCRDLGVPKQHLFLGSSMSRFQSTIHRLQLRLKILLSTSGHAANSSEVFETSGLCASICFLYGPHNLAKRFV